MGRDGIEWNRFYAGKRPGDLPWSSATAEPELVDLVRRGDVKPCRALDLGCGQGTEAVFLAVAGFRVSAIDVSSRALTMARRLARHYGAKIDFRRRSALDLPFRVGTFDLATDRGCFHHVDPARRGDYAAEVARVVRRGGRLFVRAFSDRAPKGRGPHCLTRREMVEPFAGRFRLERLFRYASLGTGGPPPTILWAALFRRR